MSRLVVALLSLAWAAGVSAQVVVDPPLDPELLRATWRYVGIKSDPAAPTCPTPPPATGWSTQPMFPGTENRRLQRFCVYESAAARPRPPQVDGLARLDRDAMAVQASGGALDDALWPSMAAHFLSQAGDVEPPLTGGDTVRLAIVDTAATREQGGENYPGTSPHGYTLLNLARRLTCAGSNETSCTAQVSSRLALRWECFDREQLDLTCRNTIEGGLFGLIGEMAQAIHDEVRRWQDVGPPRLVLNLSIGWPTSFGGLEANVADMPAPVAAVHAALEDALCRGAWVVAAAGNREGGPTPELGPIVPAAWELRAAPSFVACVALGLAPRPADFPKGNAYRPLVYAAGGVRADDLRLVNSRPGSSPPLSAFADHARVATLAGAPTAALTGSSVAAVVVSSAGALAAYYRPDLAPWGIMQEVYDGARGLGRAADVCLGGIPCPSGREVRRVDLCGTLAHACRLGGARCPASLPACAAPLALDWSGVDLSAFRSGALAVDAALLTTPYTPIAACHFEQLRHEAARVPLDPCPHWQYHPRSPDRASEPQPGSYPCPNCGYTRGEGLGEAAGAGTLYIEIDSDYVGALTEATLKCGGQTWNLAGAKVWEAGERAEVTGIECLDDSAMAVSFTVDGARSATSPVLVER